MNAEPTEELRERFRALLMQAVDDELPGGDRAEFHKTTATQPASTSPQETQAAHRLE